MRKTLTISLICSALLVTPVKIAAQTSKKDADEAVSEAEGEDAKICKTFKVTGSRAKRERICMTKRAWAAHEARTKEEARRATAGVCGNANLCSGET